MKKYSNSYQKLFKAVLASSVAGGAIVAAPPVFVQANETGPALFKDLNPKSYYYEPVLNLSARGIINGYKDGTYRPDDSVTRGQAAKILALALGLDTVNVKNPGFTDVKETDSFYGPIAALVNAGVISGYQDKTFRPNDNLKRSQMAKIIALGFNLEKEKLTDNRFTDVNSSDAYAGYVQALLSNKITTGITATTFGPNTLVTRGQIASFIFRSELAVSQNGVSAQIVDITEDAIELEDGTYSINPELKSILNPSNLSALKGATIKVIFKGDQVERISSLEITANGTTSAEVVLDGKDATLKGNLIINGDYVTVKNLVIGGNLEIGNAVNNSFKSEAINVKGKTIVSDGIKDKVSAGTNRVYSAASVKSFNISANSKITATKPTIIFSNSSMGTIEVSKNDVTIESKGTTSVQSFVLSSNVHLKADKGVTIPSVVLSEGATSVTIDAPVTNLTINSSSKLTIEGSGDIGNVSVKSNGQVNLETTGKITNIEVASTTTKLSFGANTQIGNLVLPEGVDAGSIIADYDNVKGNIEKIGGETNPEAKPSTPAPPATGGGGNTGGGITNPVDPTPEIPKGVNLDYQPIGQVTDISSDVRFNEAENKFDVPAGVLNFTFTDSSYQFTVTYEGGKWTFATDLIPVVPGTPVTPDTVTVDYVTTKSITALTEGVTFAEGKFNVPSNLSTFEFIEEGIKVNATLTSLEWEYTALVDGETQLIDALLNSAYSNIKLSANISGLKKNLIVKRPVTIIGNSHTLTFTEELNGLDNSERQGILINADNVTISGLTVEMANSDGWQGLYAIQVYSAENVILNDITARGADGAILVNGSEVTLTGTITVSGNEFGGIEVSRGTALVTNSALDVKGTLINDNEKYEQPTVWVVEGQGSVSGIDGYTTNTTIKDDQIQYYQHEVNAKSPVTDEASVGSLAELINALGNAAIATINLTDHILDIGETIVINRQVTINGGGKQLTFTDALNGLANGKRQGVLVAANGVEINDLQIQMSGDAGWQGVYGIQVYDAENVILNDITASGADGAILVNGSEVKLTGRVTVSGNEFGGIEVSRGTALVTNSALDVEGTLINDNEKYEQPTVWVVEGQGSVSGIDGYKTNTTIKDDQIQYYQDEENAKAPVTDEASVGSLAELINALGNEAIATINLTDHILDIGETIVINRQVTINGGGKQLTFTGALNGLANGKRQGVLVAANGVEINDLQIQMSGDAGWRGVYGIQVYDAENVILKDITASGADGAILVNGSEVTLTGTITVSGNGFGGIEVSRGTALVTNSALDVKGTLINDNEKYEQPTVWVVEGQGSVSGIEGYTTNTTIKDDQIQYYQHEVNAKEPVTDESIPSSLDV